jgi:hypothetical protein
MAEAPELPEKEWPEVRKAKASANTGWGYFGDLVKVMHKALGEEKTIEILTTFMAENARKYIKSGMAGFGIKGNDPWALASYLKLATGDIIGYKIVLIQ